MRREKGITLISLIITIIVMLILIAVTVNVLIESGIIGSAKNAANKTQTAYENEAVLNQITIGGVEYNSIEEYKQQRCNHNYENGACTLCGASEPVAGITASTIANATTKSEYYGDYVTGITLNNGDTSTQWRIFYADANNIYLIAENYIMAGTYMVDYFEGSSGQYADLRTVITRTEYAGGASEEAIFGEGKVGRTLLKTYLDYLEANNFTKNNENMKVTAFMLDTVAWNGYTDSNQTSRYIDYAIGGPTLEMLRDSYNGYTGVNFLFTGVQAEGETIGGSQGAIQTCFSLDSVTSSTTLYIPNRLDTKSYPLASPAYTSQTNAVYLHVVFGRSGCGILFTFSLPTQRSDSFKCGITSGFMFKFER